MSPTNPLARLLGRNPFSSLQEHMRAVIACVDDIPALFEAMEMDDSPKVEELSIRIAKREDDADKIKNQLRLHLPRTMFLPVNRRDLLDVLDMQDSIADVAEDIAELVAERSMRTPPPLRGEMRPYVQACVDVCHLASEIIEELDELLETGFRGREVTAVDAMIEKLNLAETRTDEMEASLARTLFRHEDDLKPVSVVFWYRLLELVGDLADYAEKVGNRLRLLIAQ